MGFDTTAQARGARQPGAAMMKSVNWTAARRAPLGTRTVVDLVLCSL